MGLAVSPGFNPRPSLSDEHHHQRLRHDGVSPGFNPRPSLSGLPGARGERRRGRVSPGFNPRPSLSEHIVA